MLHLLPLKHLLRFALGLTALAVGVIVVLDRNDAGQQYTLLTTMLRHVLIAEAVIAALFCIFWRFIPGLTTRWLFPYIDGSWDGHIYYTKYNEHGAEIGPGEKQAQLYVYQSVSRIRLVLETDESTSETMIVKPERDINFSRFSLFYIYENNSRIGIANNGRSYRGTAIMHIAPGTPDFLGGNYFTDQKRSGHFHFERRKDSKSGLCNWIRSFFSEKGAPKSVQLPTKAPQPKLAPDENSH